MLGGFYGGKKVLVTGHTGFKGSWLSVWLSSLGAEVCGYSLDPYTVPSMFRELGIAGKISGSRTGDITDAEALNRVFNEFKPEIVFHLAAQPIVRLSYSEPVLTYRTNVMGTLNVLEAARHCGSVKAFVNVTTDKCYENTESGRGYREDDPMGGYDMYSSSKGCVEIMSSSFRRCFLQREGGYAMATARAGNVIGGGDWAPDRLIPDCVRAINAGRKIEIRNPFSVRPWQHVLEPLSGYLLLGYLLFSGGAEFAEGYNFGPGPESVLRVSDIVKDFVRFYGSGEIIVHKKDSLHEAGLLALNIEKAEKKLGWTPSLTPGEAVKNTVEWYKRFYSGSEMYDFTVEQIKNYQEKIKWNRI